MTDIAERAKIFAALHAGPKLLVLPNAWDAGTARVVENAGASAIATSSAAIAWAHGYPDGQYIPFETVLATLREITRVVRIPVSADIEGAYAHDAPMAAVTVSRIIEAGIVGINIEDGTDAPDLLAKKIENLKAAATRVGVPLWVNARIDTYLKKLVPLDQAYDETVRRARIYRDAGANSIFVAAAVDPATIGKLVEAVVLPLNVMAWPGLPAGASLEKLGVRRLSAGAAIGKLSHNRVHALAKAFLADGNADILTSETLANPDLNVLMRKD